MRFIESKRTIALTIWFTVMLTLPVLTEVYYAVLYYTCLLLLIPITVYRIVQADKFEKRFYQSWHKARKHGFWVNVVREGLRTMIIITVVVAISQFLVNGRTPLYIVSKLSSGILILLLLLLLGFGLLGGVVAWHENDKRYYRIHYGMKSNNS
jgi:hypothetical protein